MPERSIPHQNKHEARKAGLRYVSDSMPGIHREKHGTGFSYYDSDDSLIQDKEIIKRIKKLRIPPAWRNVWICSYANGHLQVTGYDKIGRKQYLYHHDWSEIRSHSKFNRLLDFAEKLPELRNQVIKDLRRKKLCKEKVVAAAVSLMERSYLRVGSAAYTRENNSYGLTTLLDRHVQINGQKVSIKFPGKRGIKQEMEISDRRFAKILKQCREIRGQTLFQYYKDNGEREIIDSGDINDYIELATGEEFTAKDFRTWAGSFLAFRHLRELEPEESKTALHQQTVDVIRLVAKELGNTIAVCRKYYVHPSLVESYENGSLQKFLKRYKKPDNHDENGHCEKIFLKFLAEGC